MSDDFNRLCQDYLETVWRLDPVRSTGIGIHQYDDILTDYTPDGVEEDLQSRTQLLDRCQEVDPQILSEAQRLDLTLMVTDLTVGIAEHELALHQRAPYIYNEALGRALNVIMEREFAPLEERAELLYKRLQAIPGFLATALSNLEPSVIPPLWVDIALSGTGGLRAFLSRDLVAFADLTPLAGELRQAAEAAEEAVVAYRNFLERIKPDCHGSFAVGRNFFDRKLKNLQMVDMDAEQLYQFGLEKMAEDEKRLIEHAKTMDPKRSWEELVEEIKDDHPQAEDLLKAYGHEMDLAEQFVREHDLVTIPAGAHCVMDWTPVYMRATLPIGVMSTTSAFEPGLNSKWLITPINPDAPPERQKEHLRDNNYAFQRSIALHEVYPGHHLQRVCHKLGGSDVRKNFSAPIFVEGWGLYTEDLMLETGFLSEPKVHLLQLKNALWRAVRVVIDTGLHTRNMSFADAVELLRSKVRMETHMAEGEVRRYTTHSNPTYPSSYLVGKTLILQLRKDYAERLGDAYTLKGFHDHLLSYGSIPVKLIRQAMLG